MKIVKYPVWFRELSAFDGYRDVRASILVSPKSVRSLWSKIEDGIQNDKVLRKAEREGKMVIVTSEQISGAPVFNIYLTDLLVSECQ